MILLCLFSLFAALSSTQSYHLVNSYPGATFLDNFDFFTSWDPTFGYIHYVDRLTAEQRGMITYTPNTTRWGVESTEVLDPSANLGRLSLRLTSKQSWTHGLFIVDLAHMPHNSCGAWPAYWTVGSGVWPSTGEIDIVEFTNNGPNNLMALHTNPGCSIAGADMSGQLDYNDCNQGAAYTGCAIKSKAVHGSGAAFNEIGGGVYAMEWTSRYVRIWFFPRGAIPESILSADSTNPDISTFGVPVANFEGSCDLDTFLYNHTIVFNVDFCGTYAGNVYGQQGCPMTDPTDPWKSCNEYVALTPQAFSEVYWEVNHLNVYQADPSWQPVSSALPSVVPAASTSTISTASGNAQGRPTTPTMSLAGTTPTDISGSFTATSSALSVLSSISTASVASTSSLVPTLSSIPATSSALISTSDTSFTTTPSLATPPAVASTPLPATLVTSDSVSCNGQICFVTVVVPQTVTVYESAVHGASHRHPAHAPRGLGASEEASQSIQLLGLLGAPTDGDPLQQPTLPCSAEQDLRDHVDVGTIELRAIEEPVSSTNPDRPTAPIDADGLTLTINAKSDASTIPPALSQKILLTVILIIRVAVWY